MKKNKFLIHFFIFAIVVFFFSAWETPLSICKEIDPDLYSQFKYRFIGPQGNRVIAVVGVPGDPNICYAGAASGGIFKSIDGGINWEPIFDDQQVSSIGSLAIAPSDFNVVWAGTGETFIRSNISQGNGIYKSTDAGKTWKCMGLEKSGRIGRIVVDPRNPEIVFAAAMGHCYGPQEERGVFRTTDGGKTWERVLFVDENTGCSDIVMDPNNPRILFAGMWTMFIRTWGRWSGGPGDGLYMSRDEGTTWKRLSGHGLPETTMGKIALAMSPSNSNRIYALIETKEGVLWRSDDCGENWKLVNRDHTLTQRPHYYSRCAVSPDDYNEIYFVATRFSVSLDGGETFEVASRAQAPGGDNHDVWVDPLIPGRIMVGSDNPGVSISVNRGKTWNRIRLPVAQMYHVYVDNKIPYYVYGNRQDGPSTRGPSNSLTRGKIPSGMWHSVGGCECGFAIPDPVDKNIVWSGCYSAQLDRFDLRTGHSRSVDPYPDGPLGSAAADAKFRFQWTFPIAISPHNHNKVYVGSQHVHQTIDGGNSWTIISPDLSTNDKTKQKREGGITSDDATPTYCCCLFAIAESPLEEGLIWAGTNDGLLHVTRDGGSNWTNVTDNIPNLLPWGTVSNIEPSRYDAGTCYFTMDYHQVNNRDPYVYKTTDYGKSWKLISSNVPKSELSYAHCIREDPVRKGLLYLGTENALYVSFNDGTDWHPLQNNLPHAPVHWLTIQEHFNDLVVGTYGRGFWILDDIFPLQQLTAEVLETDVHLFAPRPAYRFRNIANPMINENDQCAGENPPYGASINYYLESAPDSDIKITILDNKDQIVRTLKGPKKPGINRIWWDLRYEKTKQAKLRTSPIGHPWVVPGPEGWRALGRGVMSAPLAVPDTYTIKLIIGDQEFTQKLEIIKDPNSAGSVSDIQVQVKMLLEIRDNINHLVDMINQIEWIRKQIYDLKDMLKEDKETAAIITAGEKLDKKLIAVEENLFQMRLTGGTATQDSLRWPNKYYSRILRVASQISKSDFPPTKSQVEAHERFTKRLESYQSQLNELLDKDFPAFNNLLREKNIPNIILVEKE
jgi:hypothetical protein